MWRGYENNLVTIIQQL